MCPVDAPKVSTSVACPDHQGELLLDCNNDDYFHPDPPRGNWLHSHWNIADSSFVQRVPVVKSTKRDLDHCDVTGFADVDREGPHGRAIGWLADRGVTRGCDAGCFCPDQPVTRGQMAAFLHRFVPDLAVVAGPVGLGDVLADGPVAGDIARLVGTGVTRGCDEGSICPDQPVSRAQMAAFLYRVFALGATSPDAGFTDVPGDSPFRSEIAWLAQMGISDGCGNSDFCPDAPVTRGRMASFLYRTGQIYFDE